MAAASFPCWERLTASEQPAHRGGEGFSYYASRLHCGQTKRPRARTRPLCHGLLPLLEDALDAKVDLRVDPAGVLLDEGEVDLAVLWRIDGVDLAVPRQLGLVLAVP